MCKEKNNERKKIIKKIVESKGDGGKKEGVVMWINKGIERDCDKDKEREKRRKCHKQNKDCDKNKER